MSDARLRELERRFKETGATEDEAALLLGRVRAGDLEPTRLDLAAQRPQGDEAALRARLAADARDHAARFDLAALLAHRGDFAAAFDELLEVVLRDKGEPREAARARMVEWFGLCRDAEVVDRARRRLSMYLN